MAITYFTKTCPQCGNLFTNSHKSQRFCSPGCARHSGAKRPTGQRFWSKVDKRGSYECWPWIRYVNNCGYGVFGLNGKNERAHRVAWELVNGPIPPGMQVLHRCDNPPCCNVRHLFIGHPADNAADKIAKGRGRHGVVLGEKHPLSKLIPADVIAIRASTEPGSVLAKKYGIAPRTVGRIRHRQRWKHVP